MNAFAKSGLTLMMGATNLILSGALMADGGYLRTAAPLDEPRGYCLDVAGFGANARPDEPLRVHTCKYEEDNADQLFRWVDAQSDRVEMPAYNRCLTAESAEPGAILNAAECGASDLQAWTFVPNGNLVLRDHSHLCITIGEESKVAGSVILVSPGYRFRSSTMELCRGSGDELQNFRWGRDDEHKLSLANGLRMGMPTHIQEGILEIHNNPEGSALTQTNALYADAPRINRPAEVKSTLDISYGEHERHKLDVHVGTSRRGESLQPVVVYLHGGGYLRGSKESAHNVGEYFASLGLVGVSGTYRLAPEVQWPEGANDIGEMVEWIKKNIADHGGDPDRVFLVAKSSAAGHATTYALRPEVLEREYPSVAGVVLISGSLGTGTEAYFGVENLEHKQIFGNISQVEIPFLITHSEFDSESVSASALRLAFELTTDHGQMPRLRQLQGHNHYSPNISIGTSDRMLSDEILDFILFTPN